MEKNINYFINLHKNTPILLLGSSPNMANFPFKNFKGKIITFGDTIYRGRNLFQADYWIAANYDFPVPDIPEHLELINSFKNTTFIFADSVAYSTFFKKSEDFLNKNLKVDWCCFDERHFARKKCRPKRLCCDLIDKYPDRITLQELVAKLYNYNNFPKTSTTTAEHALALALLMGGNPIFIQGVEIPLFAKDYIYYPDDAMDDLVVRREIFLGQMYKKYYSGKFFVQLKNYSKKIYNTVYNKVMLLFYKQEMSDFYKFGLDNVLSNFKIYNDMGSTANIKIFNLSKKSNLNKVPTFNYLSPEKVIEKLQEFKK